MELQFMSGNNDEMREAAEREIAAAHERHARFFRLFRDLQPEQLGTLLEMFTLFGSEMGQRFLHHQIGVIHTLQTVIHGRCACGDDHDKELIEDEQASLDSERHAENNQASMIEYGLIRDVDGKLFCKNCQAIYSSLDDRMLRPPGAAGCPGCQQKAKWG